MRYFYFVIPTINGEIVGEPYITFSLDYDFKEEVTIYMVCEDCSVKEVDS